jgi:ribosomal protein S18 acetylase RimI-like enzyme
MHIERVAELDPELIDGLRRLLPQLTDRALAPLDERLSALLASSAGVFMVAREGEGSESILGMGCLGMYHALTGTKAVIEDLVVDHSARHRGVGQALLRSLVDWAREKGAQAVTLTSNPSREAANRLYRRFGFELRKTNSYYLHLK